MLIVCRESGNGMRTFLQSLRLFPADHELTIRFPDVMTIHAKNGLQRIVAMSLVFNRRHVNCLHRCKTSASPGRDAQFAATLAVDTHRPE